MVVLRHRENKRLLKSVSVLSVSQNSRTPQFKARMKTLCPSVLFPSAFPSNENCLCTRRLFSEKSIAFACPTERLLAIEHDLIAVTRKERDREG